VGVDQELDVRSDRFADAGDHGHGRVLDAALDLAGA